MLQYVAGRSVGGRAARGASAEEMSEMDEIDLRTYIEGWFRRYPGRPEWADAAREAYRRREASLLCELGAGDVMTPEQVERLINWKFGYPPARRGPPRKGIRGDAWSHANDCITRALARARGKPSDDLAPLQLLLSSNGGIKGWTTPMASTLLAVRLPKQYTVADRRALASLRALRLMDPPATPGSLEFGEEHWQPYLRACRLLAGVTEYTLREVDQALWTANGQNTLPRAE
jgi:hypothetical protein